MTKFNTIFTVMSEYTFVLAQCPYCEENVEMGYKDFFRHGDPYEVIGSSIACPNCLKEIQIEDIEWD